MPLRLHSLNTNFRAGPRLVVLSSTPRKYPTALSVFRNPKTQIPNRQAPSLARRQFLAPIEMTSYCIIVPSITPVALRKSAYPPRASSRGSTLLQIHFQARKSWIMFSNDDEEAQCMAVWGIIGCQKQPKDSRYEPFRLGLYIKYSIFHHDHGNSIWRRTY